MSRVLRNAGSRSFHCELLARRLLVTPRPWTTSVRNLASASESRRNGESRTWIIRASEHELAAQRAAGSQDAACDPGPLRNLTIGIKDNICTKDFPTTCGSQILDGYTSPFNATVVENLKSKGAIIAGKTNLDEFGMGSHSMNSAFGHVANPVTSGTHSAGGSSGGSAAAVKDGSCDAAIGTDTGGSVRLPAAFCGVVGFKPSYGLLSRFGVVAYANSLDTVGIFSNDVSQASFMLEAMSRPDENDPTCLTATTRSKIAAVVKAENVERQKRPIRIGVPIEYMVQLSEDVKQAWITSLDKFRQDPGFEIVPVSLPSTKLGLSAYYILAPAEASSNLAKYDGVRYGNRSAEPRSSDDVLYARTRFEGLGDEVRRRILLGSYSLSSAAMDNYFIQAQKVRRLVQQDFNRVFSMPHPLLDHDATTARPHTPVDVLVTPTAPTAATPLDEVKEMNALDSYTSDVFAVPASLAGLPALSHPFGQTKEGLPIGLQVIGQYGDDAHVLDIAGRIATF